MTFQLLLFFLLTFTFREAEGLIPGTLPQGDIGMADITDLPMIYVKVHPDPNNAVGAIYLIKGQNVAIRHAGELYRILEGEKRVTGSANRPVVIEPRGDVRWEHVVNAFNQAVRAKYKKIGFATSS